MKLALSAGPYTLPPLTRAQVLIALALTLVWTALLALLSREWLAAYYPIADEWALLAHADPAIVSPLTWFTEGFSNYFAYHSELATPFANFLRPGFNFCYWVLGLLFVPESPWRLGFNFLAIGACSGMAWLCVAHTGSRWALPLAALLPLFPGYITATAHLVPCLAYDPLVAALSLAGLLAFQRQRLLLAAGVMTFAVLTKETALPVAVALPAVYAWQQLRDWRQPARWGWLLLLAAPVLIWVLLRTLAFVDVTGGTYAFHSATPWQMLKIMLKQTAAWPLWTYPSPFKLSPAASATNAALWLLMLINFVVVAALALRGLAQWLRGRPLDAVLVALLASEAFMLLVGHAPRYGAVLHALLVVSIVRWLAERQRSPAALPVSALLMLGVAVSLGINWRAATNLMAECVQYAQVSRKYVETLRTFPAGSRVLVLNDPATWHSQTRWLAAVSGVRAEVHKITDFACPGGTQRIAKSCAVTLTPTDDPLHFEFAESCGFDLCYANASGRSAIDVQLDGGVRLVARPEAVTDPSYGRAEMWQHAGITLDRGDAWLLWFDPVTRSFHQRYVAAVP